MSQTDVIIGHLGWSQSHPGVEFYQRNDPAENPRTLLAADAAIAGREGATVVVVVLPGRFHKAAETVADRVQAAVQDVA